MAALRGTGWLRRKPMEITPALRATRFSQLKPGELFIFPNDSSSVVALVAADPSRDGDLCAIPLGPALPPELIGRIANLPGHTGVLSYGTEFIVQLPSHADGWPLQVPPPDKACFVLSEQGLYLRANFYPEPPGFQACFVDMKDGKILTPSERIRAEFLTPRNICGFAAEWALLTRESKARVILSYPAQKV
jgi:hypothetical protein